MTILGIIIPFTITNIVYILLLIINNNQLFNIEGFGKIGDVVEVTLDNGKKFNFMILDTKSKKHKSSELSPKNQCQNEWGHGYMLENNAKVQLSICEFITSKTKNGVGSAKNYPSGAFLKDRYVKKAKIIWHANIE